MRCSLFLRPTMSHQSMVAAAGLAGAHTLRLCRLAAAAAAHSTTMASSACVQQTHCPSLYVARRFSSSASSSSSSSSSGPSKPHVVHYSKLGMDGFTDAKYNAAADEFLENLESKLEGLDTAELEDVSCNGGVLTIETASKGIFIINKQAPNVQLWLSSPISGPHHYDMVTSTINGVESVLWKSDNDAHDLAEKLASELSDVLYQPFQL